MDKYSVKPLCEEVCPCCIDAALEEQNHRCGRCGATEAWQYPAETLEGDLVMLCRACLDLHGPDEEGR